jgi:S1/P1 Nuclease
MHLVGDLHQPLHAVNGISDTLPDGDKGGNRVLVTGVNQGAPELHAFWDDLLGKPAGADRTTHRPRLDKDAAAADEVIDSVPKVRSRKTADNLDPAEWAKESFDIAKRDAYDLQLEPITIDKPPKDPVEELTTELTDKYDATAKRDAQRQVRLAGHRLALMLKQVLH